MDLIKDLFKGDKVIWIIFLFLCLIYIDRKSTRLNSSH